MLLRPEPPGKDDYGRDPAYRMKGFLKVMLRRFGWRCLSVRPKPPDIEEVIDDGESDHDG